MSDSNVRPQISFDEEVQNINNRFSEDFIFIDSFSDKNLDDEVFVEEYQEESSTTSSKMQTSQDRQPRIRRVSDVIDSIGSSPSSPVSSRGKVNFDFNEKTISEITQRSFSVVRRDDNYMTPTRVRTLSSATDSAVSSLATTPTDPGYYSSTPPPPINLLFRPKWYRHSASTPPKEDSLDAQVMCVPMEEQQQQTTTSPTSESCEPTTTPLTVPAPQARMPVAKNSLYYNMGHARVGYAYIFNHEEFTFEDTNPRPGTNMDAVRMEETLTYVGFTVTVFHNLKLADIVARINELAAKDHNDCDCVMVAVLSHGFQQSYILACDQPYSIDKLWTPFTPDRCTSLAGKPKLFYIQACRGNQLDNGVHLTRSQVDSDVQSYKIPAMADFLFAYSTTEGFYSWRNPEKGTWFIQSLCEVFENEVFNEDLSTLLTMVSHKVALSHESYNDKFPWQHQQKQVPQIVSTLIRRVQFQQKPQPPAVNIS